MSKTQDLISKLGTRLIKLERRVLAGKTDTVTWEAWGPADFARAHDHLQERFGFSADFSDLIPCKHKQTVSVHEPGGAQFRCIKCGMGARSVKVWDIKPKMREGGADDDAELFG